MWRKHQCCIIKYLTVNNNRSTSSRESSVSHDRPLINGEIMKIDKTANGMKSPRQLDTVCSYGLLALVQRCESRTVQAIFKYPRDYVNNYFRMHYCYYQIVKGFFSILLLSEFRPSLY